MLPAHLRAALSPMRRSGGLVASLLHLSGRAPLALRAASGGCVRGCAQLHVFARLARSDRDFCKVFVADGADASDLKDAIIDKLQLGAAAAAAAPGSVRLLRERKRGAAPTPLDCSRGLAAQGVRAGARVLVELAAAPAQPPPAAPPPLALAPLPAPLAFLPETVGGTPMMVADLAPASAPVPLPFFMELEEHAALQRFLAADPAAASPRHLSLPRMLMLTGTVKSGKSRTLHHVIPGMLAAAHAEAPRARRRPVLFSYTFPLYSPAEECAQHLVDALVEFARGQGLCLPAPLGRPLNQFPSLAATLAARVHERGGELWLLLDELGAPIVASEPRGAALFTLRLKDMLQQCWAAGGSVAGTGSGMVALLTALRAAAPNGFALWSVVEHVRLGRRPPSPAAALAMARRLHAHHAAAWPGGGQGALARALSPERCVAELAREAHGDVTDPRPALLAHLLELVRGGGSGSAEQVWARARNEVLLKLCLESAQDAAVALERLPAQALCFLRALADGRAVGAPRRPGEVGGVSARSSVLAVALLLCEDAGEEGDAAAAAPILLPPYGALVRSWVTRDGLLAVSSADGSQGLPMHTRSNLKAIHTLEPLFSPNLRSAISEAVLRVMLDNDIGAPDAGSSGLRAPGTVEEFVAVPALACVLSALKEEAAQVGGRRAPSLEKLNSLLRTPLHSPARAEYMQFAGLKALLLLRHMEAHVAYPTGMIVRGGFSCQVIVSAVAAAVESALAHEGSAFALQLGVLSAQAPPAAPQA